MKLTRRTFLKGSGAALAGLAAGSLLVKVLEPPASAEKETLQDRKEEWVPTACQLGKQNCGILARRINGRVVKLEGHPDHPRNRGRLCPKGVAQIMDLYDPSRVRTPLVRTNQKGVPGKWRVASWDETLDLVAEQFKKAQAKDKRLAAMVLGRTFVTSIVDTAFRQATGTPHAYGRRGNDCGGASEDAALVTWGSRGAITPDLRLCKYLICYWNLTQAGGPGLCWITLPQEVVEAKKRGMKVVAIDPYARSAASFADEWVPIRPGTDMAFWLAVIRILLAEGFVDQGFLKAHTNAPSLVKADSTLLRDGDKELVWDTKTGKAAPYGPGVDPGLWGEFTVAGEKVRTALQVLQDHVQQYTAEWTSAVCGVLPQQIHRISRELGQNAMIGSRVVIDGVEVPYRPVAFGMHGVATKFHSALQTNRAVLLAFMILGAIEAAGSPHFWNKQIADPARAHEGWLRAAARESADRIDLGGTKWFPLGSSGYLTFPETVPNPGKYGLPYRPEDMVLIVDFVNPVITSRPTDRVLEAWKRFGFVAVVTPFLSATADYAADVVLPCGTLDKWEGPLEVKTLYYSADTVRFPAMQPLGQAQSEFEIYRDLCEKMGRLYGQGGFVDQVNRALGIKEQFRLPLDRKPGPEQVLEAWARSKHGIGLDEVRRRGAVVNKVPASNLYLSAGPRPYMGVRGHFYVEVFPRLREEMRKRGVSEGLWRHYTPYPTWTPPPFERAPQEYDLYLMDFKRIEHKHSRSVSNALLQELLPANPLVMNTKAARERGLRDGDGVWVESIDPLSGEKRRVTTTLATTELIRPDTVALTHHVSRLTDPNVNSLIPFGEGFWDMGGGWFSHIRVKVWKAEQAKGA